MKTPGDVARKSLEAALTAWQNGQQPGSIQAANPAVQATDSDWSGGKKLESFEILGEEPADSDKRFKVKLNLGKAAPAVEATYIVLGADPVLVFRSSDYDRMINMDNNPAQKKPRR